MSGDTRGGLGSSYSREGKRKGWGDFLKRGRGDGGLLVSSQQIQEERESGRAGKR